MNQNDYSPLIKLAYEITHQPRFKGDPAALDNGQRAALARLDPNNKEIRPHQIAALAHVLVAAGLDPENWQPDTWQRWAIVAHGIALTGHDPNQKLGKQLCNAEVSELRVTKLLTARGDAFRQLLPRLFRLLAGRQIQPNWRELGALILHEGHNEELAEKYRLKIAASYFSALANK